MSPLSILPHTHEQREAIAFDILIPDHDKRVNSAEHRAVRHELIEERKFGCFICSRTIDDFAGDASQLEIHHLFAEYAEFTNIDPRLVNADHPIFAPYNTEGVYDSVDDKSGSLVLCALHHRGGSGPGRLLEEGIHHSAVEAWLMQKYIADSHLHRYLPNVIVVRRGVTDESGFLPSYLLSHPDLAIELRAMGILPQPGAKKPRRRKAAVAA